MSILRRLARPETRAVSYSDVWNSGGEVGSGSVSLSGTRVGEDSLLGLDMRLRVSPCWRTRLLRCRSSSSTRTVTGSIRLG